MRSWCLVTTLCLLITGHACAAPGPDITSLLTFEAPATDEAPAGWGGGPSGTLFLDTTTIHGGTRSGRLERTATSQNAFSTFTTSLPVDFAGKSIELRGWLRTEDVSGWSGLWMREDGKGGAVQFDNMQQRSIKGTTPWTQYSVMLPLDSRATTISFGALMAGLGKTWVDDLELLVDGIPIAQVPRGERVPTVLESDHEFDGGSGITLTEVSPTQVANLATLGKVWGFLKYHHPAGTGGQRHWDYELFRLLPGVLRAENQAQRNAVLVDWIDGLGVPASCAPCAAAPVDVHLAADIAWIDDTALLGTELAGRLRAVHRFRAECDRQFFVSFHPGVGNPDFSAELPYENLALPDSGYRILALLRFWNLVAYWFPYRDLIEENWDDVLLEFLPRLVAANDRDTYQLELMALVARIHDTHANLWSSLDVRPPRGDASVPVVLRFVNKDAVVAGYSQEISGPATSLVPGDVIEQIDGQSVRQLVAQWTPWYGASNQDARLREIAKSLTRGPAGPCSLAIRRGETRLEVTAERIAQDKLDPRPGATHDRPGETCLRLAADIAYLKLSSVKTEDLPQYLAVMDSTRGVIVDIRNYPSSFVIFTLGGHFVTEPTAFTRFTVGDAANPGAFVWTRTQSIPPLQPHYTGKVVVLVDETTQSSAEYTAMALRAAGAVVIGSTTAGADGNVSAIPLPGGLRAMFSGIGVFYPDRTPTQRIGIVPDIVVKPTLAGILDGRDEVLEAALAEIRRDAGPEPSTLQFPIR